MHKEVNIVSGNAESTVCFRMCGLDFSQMKMWRKKFSGLRLATFISEFYRHVGGTLDFSFVAV